MARFRVVAAIVGVSVIVGAAVGGIWYAIAPRPELVVVDGGVGYTSVFTSGAGMDMWFGMLGLVAGVVCALCASWRFPTAGWTLLVALVVGGLAGSVLAWQLAMALAGGSTDISVDLAAGLPAGAVFEGPLALNAYGVLGVWPVAAIAALVPVFALKASKHRRAYSELWQENFGVL